MFNKSTYKNRRQQLTNKIDKGLILLLGNEDVGMNYASNIYHFRQDSSFLYFIGIDQAGLGATIDVETGETTVYGDELTMEDIVWTGEVPSIKEKAAASGIEKTAPKNALAEAVQKAVAQRRIVHFLPPYRAKNQEKLRQWLNIEPAKQKTAASRILIDAVINIRSYKTAEEIQEMTKAVNVSHQMHHNVMRTARIGQTELDLANIAFSTAARAGMTPSYPIIMTKNGQVLHSHDHSNLLKSGDLVLGDYGAQTRNCYAGDITRTFPIDTKFTAKQKDIYEIVLKAEMDSITACRPSIPYKEIHFNAAKIIGEGLKDLGLMKGNISDAVTQGATALFFPHGLGHMIGMDVHDMEDLGENYVGYSEHIKRSELFGTAYLRLGRELEEGFVLTVEPGIYFIPQLIDQWQKEGKFNEFINYSKVQKYRDFSGIRIEDDVLITKEGHKVLGDPIAKSVAEVEALRAEAND